MKRYRSFMLLALASATLGAYSKVYADEDPLVISVSDDSTENTDADLSSSSVESTEAGLPLSFGAENAEAGLPVSYPVENTGAPYTTPFPDFDHLPIV